MESLRKCRTSDLSCRRYIFVGFNVLTLAELSMFELLDTKGVADFYWDNASPAMRDKGNAASRFIDRNTERFRSRYDIDTIYPHTGVEFPEIHLKGIPSSTGQAKMAGKLLNDWIADGTISDPANAIDTAVVLPDDSLLIPMIHSVPEQMSNLNVTMGLPMRTTSFASLINSLVSMHLRATETRGEWCYFYDDIKNVATHPLLGAIDRELSLIHI